MSYLVPPRLLRSGAFLHLIPLLLTLCAVSPVDADDDPPPQVQSRNLSLADGWVHDAILPGVPLDVAPYPGGGVAVLVLPEDADDTDKDGPDPEDDIPRKLYRIQGKASDVEPIAVLAADIDDLVGRGDRLWLGGEDTIHALAADETTSEPLLELEGVDLGALRSRGLVPHGQGSPVVLPQVGRLALYTESDDGLQEIDAVELPVRARRKSRGFELWSPAVLPVENAGRTVEGLWGTQTEALGSQRFRALLIRPNRPAGEQIEENWFRFKAPEDIQQHHWVTVDGRPALIAATTPGDKLGIFQKLDLRIFYTGADRTRAGRGPTMSLETVSRRWYRVEPSIHELTGDGKDDLVVVQLEGMGGGDLVIDLFPGKGNGRFEDRRPRRTKLKDQGGSRLFGEDFNNDQKPDLVVLSGGRLSIYSVDPTHKRKVLRPEPYFTLDRGTESLASTEISVEISAGDEGTEVETFSARGRLQSFDTDGDDRPEIVLSRTVQGRAVIRVVSVKPR